MKKDKIIFLDFDGVLNSTSSTFLNAISLPSHLVMRAANPSEISVKLIDFLIEYTNAKIVVTSSWKTDKTIEKLQICLKDEFGLKNYISVVDKIRLPELNEIRGDQIEDYIINNKIDTYVIIDDCADMLESQFNNFVQTDYETGFQLFHLKKCLFILNGNDDLPVSWL